MLVMCFCLFGFSQAQVNLNNGLILHLPLDGNFNDVSGNGHTVKPRNISFSENCSGTPGRAAYFNGNNSLIEIPSSPSLNTTEKLTISFWIYIETSQGSTTLISRAKDEPSLPKRLAYSIELNNSSQPVFNTITPPVCQDYGNSLTDNTPLSTGKWYSMIGVFDGTQMILYKDGIIVSQVPTSFNMLSFCEADMSLFIGATYFDQAQTFKGSLDDIRIYNRALNAEEIKTISNTCSISDACPAPTDIKISIKSETSLLVEWKASPGSTGYDIEYVVPWYNNSDWIQDFTTNTSLLIEGLTHEGYSIRIRSKCATTNSGWVIKDFEWPNSSSCQPPFDLNATNISETEATLIWNVQTSGIGVNVQYAPIGSGNWVDAGSEITDKFFKISGLVAGTVYEWRAQTACATGPSEWVVANFTTLGFTPCNAPTNLLPGDISGNSAYLKWTGLTSQYNTYFYEAEFKESSSSNWIKVSNLNYDESFYIDTLKPITSYDWRVRMVCRYGISEWSVSSFMTTNGRPIDPRIVLLSDFVFVSAPCLPADIIFTNQSVATRTTISTQVWNFGDGNVSNQTDPKHKFAKPGSYNVTLTITDPDGRTNTKTRQVVITEMSLSFAKAGNDQVVCAKAPIQLKASGGEKYEWFPCTGLSTCNIAEPMITPGLHEKYKVKVTDKNGCIDTATIAVKYVDPAKGFYIPNAFTPNNDGLNDVFKPLANISISGTAECKIFDRFGNVVYSSSDPYSSWDGNFKGKQQPPGAYPYMIKLKGEGTCANQVIKNTVSLIR
jgi:gliding motility-associated-like protein